MVQDENFGNIWKVTIASTSTRATSNFKFTQHGGSSWQPQWGLRGGESANATKNSTIGRARVDYAGNDPDAVSFNEVSGNRYTFRLTGESHWEYRDYVVMETDNDPVTITAVSDNHAAQGTDAVTVSITLSGSKSAQEDVWVRYSTDSDFTSSQLVAATGSGTSYTATIPAHAAGVTVYYYVLTSTMPSSVITSNYDLCTLRGNNNDGDNFSYTVTETAGLPVLASPTVSGVGQTSATLGATVTEDGGASVTSRGTVWGTSANPTGNSLATGSGTGTFSHSRTGLPAGTQIYFRGYAVNSEGTGYSPDASFWTIPPNPSVSAPSGEAETSFTANWSASTGATTYFLDVSTSVSFGSFVAGYNNRNVGDVTSASVTGLVADTTYHYRVRAQGAGGTSDDSGTQSATTTSASPNYGMRDDDGVNLPTLTYWYTGQGSDVTEQGADFGGKNLGEISQLYLKGANIQTWKSVDGDVTGTTFGYKIWEQGASEPGSYTERAVEHTSGDNDQVWAEFGTEIDAMSGLDHGAYNLQVLFSVQGTGVPGKTEDGPYLATFTYEPDFGNSWHVPAETNNIGVPMRNPLEPRSADDVYFYTGTYTPASTQTNGAMFHRKVGTINWISSPLTPDSTHGDNDYWARAVQIPNGFYDPEDVVEYYFRLDYSDADTTWLGSTDNTVSERYATETEAQTNPFTYSYAPQDEPNPPYAQAAIWITSTNFMVRWSTPTGATNYFLDVSTNSEFTGGGFVPGFENRSVGDVSEEWVNDLTPGQTYYYRVRAQGEGGISDYSNVQSVTTTEANPNFGLRMEEDVRPRITYWHSGMENDATVVGPAFASMPVGAVEEFWVTGVDIKTWKQAGGDVTDAWLAYKVWLQSDGAPEEFTLLPVSFTNETVENGTTLQTWAGFDEFRVVEGEPYGIYHLQIEFRVDGTGIPGEVVDGPYTMAFTHDSPPVVMGNVWHFPANEEPPTHTMREPVNPIPASDATFYIGSYQHDNTMSGGTFFWRKDGDGAWSSAALSSVSGGIDEAYYRHTIPGGTYEHGDVIEYFFRAHFLSGADTTYLGTFDGSDNIKAPTQEFIEDYPFTFTYQTPDPVVGNSWHVPAETNNIGVPMRNPLEPEATDDVWFYSGTYTTEHNQISGRLHYRKTGESWSSKDMGWDSNFENGNQYWKTDLPGSTFGVGDAVEYYFEVHYSNADTTWLGTTNNVVSERYLDEADAQSNPFSFTYASASGPDAPVIQAATDIAQTSFTANWSASSGADNYFLDVSTSDSFGGFVSGYNNRNVGDVTSASVTGLVADTTYHYRVRAQGAGGTSGHSGVASAKTLSGPALFGNCWHFPTNQEPGTAYMRNPVEPAATEAVHIYSGNYHPDGDQTGGWLFWREVGAGSWSSNSLTHDTTIGDNAYWVATIPADTYGPDDEIEYVLQIDYVNDPGVATTFLGTTDGEDNEQYATFAEAAGNAFSFTYEAAPSDLGNCWHHPGHAEPEGTSMRAPINPFADNDVYLYTGNYHPEGNQTGGTLFYREYEVGDWQSIALDFDSEKVDNKYWLADIPADEFGPGNMVEYYFLVTYSDRADTYLASTNNQVSTRFASEQEARENSFHYFYGSTPGEGAGFMSHAGNVVRMSDDSAQFWVKIGYAQAGGADKWVDNVVLYYTVDGSEPVITGNGTAGANTHMQAFTYSHMEGDMFPDGDAMWWTAGLSGLPNGPGETIRYKIGSWNSAFAHDQFFADFQTPAGEKEFSYSLYVPGAEELQVSIDGGQSWVNADYTTSKAFIDEIAGDVVEVRARYQPGEVGAQNVEIFSNAGRRDYVNVDYTNQWISGNGYPDGIMPPDGNLLTTNDVGAYFRAFPMTFNAGTGFYEWSTNVTKCGAYRLTARYQSASQSGTNWTWYSSDGRRDHAIVISPTKAHQMTMYEVNPLTIKATDNTAEGRSTFADLLEGGDSFTEFNLNYLNRMQINCLWFQPIHPSAITDRGDPGSYEPGSPYATRDYFAVSKWFGRDETEAGAMQEFRDFVQACATNATSVGTINIMLDGVFNHSAWDAIMGQGGADLFGYDPNDSMPGERPGWYSHWQDYGAPATFYNGVWDNDIAVAPDRGCFGKWEDTAAFYFGNYAALVRHNPENNMDYLSEEDWYDFAGMTTDTKDLWKYFAYYTTFWLDQTGHAGTNSWVQELDDLGIDGLRCDFGQGLPPQFWEYFINHTRTMKWNFIFMAETLDGGIPGYRSNRHFDVLNEDILFTFHGDIDADTVRNAVEQRRNAYSGGTILLNQTSHDETMPSEDPWQTASYYGAVSTVDGIPMLFNGQEWGIRPAHGEWGGYNQGFTHFELNFGKWIPHFKQWNKATFWEAPHPDFSDGMAQWHGRVNWARLNSPALQSMNRWFLNNADGHSHSRIMSVAKYETPYAGPADSDVVLAFALVLGNSHESASFTYDLQPCFDILGLDTEKYYNVRNLASSDASALLWPEPQSGQKLYDDGIWVHFTAGTGEGNEITDDGALVQYLKLVEVGEPTLDPPTVQSATGVGQTSFTANWTTVPGAANYLLDVSTSATFGDLQPGQEILNAPVRDGSIPDGWTAVDIDPRTAADGYLLFETVDSVLETPVLDLSGYENVQLSFDVAKFGTGGDGPLTVQVSTDGGTTWTAQAFDSPTPEDADYLTSGPTEITALSSTVKIRWIRENSPSQKRLRDIVITGDLLVPDYVADYEARDVGSGSSHAVAGLSPDTTYHYRLRAQAGEVISAYSGVQSVTTGSSGPGGGTGTTPVEVPYTWLDNHFPGEHSPEEYEALANQLASNQVMTVWQTFVAGLDPTDAGATFEATVSKPEVGEGHVITWDGAAGRNYRVYWSTDLSSGFEDFGVVIPGPQGSYTDTLHHEEPRILYRISVELAD